MEIRSIGTKFVLRITFVITLIMTISGIVTVYLQEKNATADLEEKFARIQAQLVTMLSSPLWDVNQQQVIEVVHSYLQDPDILAIEIADYIHETRHFGKIPGTHTVKKLSRPLQELYPPSLLFMPKGSESIKIYHDGEFVGTCVLTFSRQCITTQSRQTKITVGLVCLTLIGIETCFILFLVKRDISRPLYVTVRAAEQIAQGEFDVTLPECSRDEIGSLHTAFVNMSRQLKASFEKIETQQKELEILNEELEERVRERTTELHKANAALNQTVETLQMAQEQLVQAEKMVALGNLVAGVAHEINTPVGIGVTAASHLELKTQEMNALYKEGRMTRSALERYLETASHSSHMILQNLNRAADQIQSFKQVAVDQASHDIRAFYLHTYIHDLLTSLYPEIKRAHHTVTVNCPDDLEITSYPGAFSQILTNLIFNSLIHGFEKTTYGTISITVTCSGQTLSLRYEDTGKGIPEDKLPHIFEPFYTTKRGQGSTGLGLHIVYNLVTQQLRGNIHCKSPPGSGAAFLIQIPLSPAPDG